MKTVTNGGPLSSSAEELRQRAIEDMPTLAPDIEEKLDLGNKPSVGIETSAAQLDLTLVEDSQHTGNQTVTVVLADDPERFLTAILGRDAAGLLEALVLPAGPALR